MANNNATIVAATLDSKDLQDSIDKLVASIETQTSAMAAKFDDAISKMAASYKALEEAGNRDVRNSERRANSKRNEIQKNQEAAASYDALAKAMREAEATSAKRFEVSDLQSLRMQQHELESLIKTAEKRNPTILTFIKQEADELAVSLQKLSTKKEQIESKGILSKREANNVKQIEEEIKRLSERYTELSSQFKEANNLDALRKQYEEVQDKIRQMAQSYVDAEQREKALALAEEQRLRAEEQALALAKQTAEEKRKAAEQAKLDAEEEKKRAKNEKDRASEYSKRLTAYGKMPDKDLRNAEDKLQKLLKLKDELRKDPLLDIVKMQTLNNHIQKTIDKVRQLRNQSKGGNVMSTTNVLGMSEKTLDEIALKLKAIKDIRGKLDINTQRSEIDQLNEAEKRLSTTQTEILGKNKELITTNKSLASALGYIRNRIIYTLTLAASTNFVKEIYEIRGQYELLERSLGVLVNSLENGKHAFQELNEMAIKSPFTLIELAGAAKQLTAYNFAANEVVETTRRLADISAALGVPMERLTYNLGQIRAQTVLNARDARDFANAGLPIVKSLSDYYTELEGKIVSTGDVYDRMSKKMVAYTDVMAVLNKMTDESGRFFEFQAKQAQTLKVQMANLTLAFNNMLNEIGEDNQSLLEYPLQATKFLLKNWESINRVIKNLAIAFGVLKLAQFASVQWQWKWIAASKASVAQLDMLKKGFASLWTSIVGIATNKWTWVFTVVAAIADLIGKYRAANNEQVKLNTEIRKNASEASSANISFLTNKGNVATRELAQQSKLSAEQGAKAWKSLEEQINTSSASANSLLAELLKIDDISERVAKGFDYVEQIQKSQAALQDLGKTAIKVTQDEGWFGIFGEGLVSDLKDYARSYEWFSNMQNTFTSAMRKESWRQKYESDLEEFRDELRETAESINNFINIHGITDPLQIREILARAKKEIKMKNPEIQGELANIFDINLDEMMAGLTNDAVDKNATLWSIFMERLKHNSSAVFQDITNDIYKKETELNADQKKAVDDNLAYFKDSMPLYYDAIKKMVDDASQLKINIGIAFNVKELTNLQEEVNKRIKEASKVLDFGSAALLPTQNDTFDSWVKSRQDAIKDLNEQNKLYEKDGSEWALKRIDENNKIIQQNKNLLDLFHQAYEAEKKTKGSQKDELGEALKQEISLIKDMQSNYDKLRKAGVGDFEAIELAARGYEATLERVNLVLSKYGIDKFNANDFAGKNVKDMLDFLVKQRDKLASNKNVKTSSIEALDVEIKKLRVDAKTYDLKKITDGLNEKLGKLDEQYELAVELQANTELGNELIDLFGLDTSQFPQTIDEYVQAYQDAVADAIKKENQDINLDDFDILKTNIKDLFSGKDVSSDFMKGLLDAQKKVKDATKKWYEDIYNQAKDLEYELGDVNQKIAIKEKERDKLLDEMGRATNEKQKELLGLQVEKTEQELDALRSGILQLMPAYEALFGSVAQHSDAMTNKLAKRLKNAYLDAQKRGYRQVSMVGGKMVGRYEYIDPVSGQKVLLTERELAVQIDKVNKEIAKSQPLFKRLKEDFTKGTDNEIDFAQGLMDVSEGLMQVKDGIDKAGNIAQALGADEETQGIISDIGQAIGGVATATQGLAQIASGDIIGGVVNVVSGLFDAISSLFNGSDRRITRQVKESEKAVTQLELAYKRLQYQIDKTLGDSETFWRRTAIANKEAQLQELQRQLVLEESRKKKNQDEDKMNSLRSSIVDLQQEIQNLTEEVVSTLTGSDVKSAAEEFIDTWVEAWKQGETTLDAIQEKMDSIIQNIVKKALANKIVANLLQPLYDQIDMATKKGSAGNEALTPEELRGIAEKAGIVAKDINIALGEFYGNLESLGIVSKTSETNKGLSALQQGIQGVTEQTANVIEGYMNNVSQQAYLRNDLLTQIRDILLGNDVDLNNGIQAQMLWQMQQSYQVQMAIQGILMGWSNANGMAVRVELV